MSKENKKLVKNLGIIFLSVLLMYPLPHDSYSIIKYIIPPIKLDNSVIYLYGIIPVTLFIIGIKGLSKLERFGDENAVVIFIAVLIIITPLMKWSIDLGRSGYHHIRNDGLYAVDIKGSHIKFGSNNNEKIMTVNLKLKDYGRKQNEFKIRVYVPESIKAQTHKEFYELGNEYYTGGKINEFDIQEEIKIKVINNYDETRNFKPQWFWEDVEYELYNNEEKVRIIRNGL